MKKRLSDFCSKHFSEGASSKKYTEKWFKNNGHDEILNEFRRVFSDVWSISDCVKMVLHNEGSDKCQNCGETLQSINMNKKNPWLCRGCSESNRVKSYQEALSRKYGSKSAFSSEDVREKSKNTMLKKYGGHSQSSASVREKFKDTMLKRHGVEYPSQSENFREKAKQTLFDRYGTQSNRKASMLVSYDDFASRLYNSADELRKLYDEHNCSLGEFSEITGIHRIQLSKLLEGDYNKGMRVSHGERKLMENICSDKKESGNRKILGGKEIDIWIPDSNLGIEYHGLYWHSRNDCQVDKRHFEKYELSRKAGIKLLQFWSSEVESKNDIVMSMINNHLGKSQKIFARKCQIKEISSREHSEFCEKNHLQGAVGASVRIGLFHEGVLVSVMSFGKSRFDKKHEWEMIRYCSLLDHNIIGGASKMWKYFLKTRKPKSVVTYADARISQGKLYETLGFNFSHHSGSNHFYTKDCRILESRVKYQKHKLKTLLEKFDKDLTGKENMVLNGYRIVYDAGNLVFTYESK